MTISTTFRNHLIQGITLFALGAAATGSFAAIDDGRYQILSRHSDLALDVAGRSTSNGANVQQWEAQGENAQNQHFDVTDLGNGYIGVGNRGVLDGIGIKIWRANNIIVRNLTIRYVREGAGDGISIEGPSSNVWIDHNTIYNSLDVDKDYYDGLVDAKKDANNISITWNHLHDSWKTALAGHSDNDSNNNRRITYAFNLWENAYSRTPLNRFGDTHIYNNYYRNILDTGINSRMGAQVRIDNNVFEDSRNPIVSCYSDQIGYWDTRGNEFINVEWEAGNDCVIAGPRVSSTTSFTPPYQYDLLPTRDVREQVTGNAGAGRCDL